MWALAAATRPSVCAGLIGIPTIGSRSRRPACGYRKFHIHWRGSCSTGKTIELPSLRNLIAGLAGSTLGWIHRVRWRVVSAPILFRQRVVGSGSAVHQLWVLQPIFPTPVAGSAEAPARPSPANDAASFDVPRRRHNLARHHLKIALLLPILPPPHAHAGKDVSDRIESHLWRGFTRGG